MPSRNKRKPGRKRNHKSIKSAPRNGTVRIIGGQWRSRRLQFPALEGLRPTTDRVRETLFNWLQAEIAGAKVLDLFTGSGALGMEALSRGASQVTFIDSAPRAIEALKLNLESLNSDNGNLFCGDAISWLNNATTTETRYDIIFIDPPFRKAIVQPCLNLCHKLLAQGGKIYLESEQELTDLIIPSGWHQEKSRIAGQVHYQLFSVKPD